MPDHAQEAGWADQAAGEPRYAYASGSPFGAKEPAYVLVRHMRTEQRAERSGEH